VRLRGTGLRDLRGHSTDGGRIVSCSWDKDVDGGIWDQRAETNYSFLRGHEGRVCARGLLPEATARERFQMTGP